VSSGEISIRGGRAAGETAEGEKLFAMKLSGSSLGRGGETEKGGKVRDEGCQRRISATQNREDKGKEMWESSERLTELETGIQRKSRNLGEKKNYHA